MKSVPRKVHEDRRKKLCAWKLFALGSAAKLIMSFDFMQQYFTVLWLEIKAFLWGKRSQRENSHQIEVAFQLQFFLPPFLARKFF
jgi:hypothetical protein